MIQDLVSRVLEATKPPSFGIDEVLVRPHVQLSSGLINHARRLLRAVQVLFEVRLYDATDGLARSILEYLATNGWLLRDPLERVEWLWRSYRGEIGLTFGSEKSPGLQRFDDWMDEVFGDHSARRLPSVQARMGPGIKENLYPAYRLLCERTHPTVAASLLDISPSEDLMEWQANPLQTAGLGTSESNLLDSAIWVIVMAKDLETVTDGELFPELEEVVSSIQEYLRSL